MAKLLCFLVSLLALTASHKTQAVVFEVTDTVGYAVFEEVIGTQCALKEMSAATDFIWTLFEQYSEADRKCVPKVSLVIDNFEGVAYEENNEIHYSLAYLSSYQGDIVRKFTGSLYNELALIWQWGTDKQFTISGWVVQGIADYVQLKAGYAYDSWANPGQGDRWDEASDVTARFLDYCGKLRHDFVAQLNRLMKNGYCDEHFVQLLGKSIDQVWNDYKAAYGGW